PSFRFPKTWEKHLKTFTKIPGLKSRFLEKRINSDPTPNHSHDDQKKDLMTNSKCYFLFGDNLSPTHLLFRVMWLLGDTLLLILDALALPW
ncbi:hypothetical protein QWJ41_21320, partial [Nocardioides sp. SOB44]